MPSESNSAQEPASSTAQTPPQSQGPTSPAQTARQSITSLTALFEESEDSNKVPAPASEPEPSVEDSQQAPASQSTIITGVGAENMEATEALADALLTRQVRRSGAPNPQLAKALEAASARRSQEKNTSVEQSADGKEKAPRSSSSETLPLLSEPSDPSSVADEEGSSQKSSAADAETDPETSAKRPEKTEASSASKLSPDQQVRIKREDDHIALIFPREQAVANPEVTVDFVDSELWQQLQQRLSGSERFWQNNTPVHLNAQNHLLDARQLQELGEALDRFDLKLTRIATSRRQTAVAAAMSGFSVDQGAELPKLLAFSSESTDTKKALVAEPLYLQTTVRSGAEIRHPGSVIIMGDLNPGSSVVADGDILIWGRLRGIAHAGAAGNSESIILAMKLEPTQLRIADAVARVPEPTPGPMMPEVAYVTAKGDIRIAEAAGFIRPRR